MREDILTLGLVVRGRNIRIDNFTESGKVRIKTDGKAILDLDDLFDIYMAFKDRIREGEERKKKYHEDHKISARGNENVGELPGAGGEGSDDIQNVGTGEDAGDGRVPRKRKSVQNRKRTHRTSAEGTGTVDGGNGSEDD